VVWVSSQFNPYHNTQRLTTPLSSGMTSRCGWRTPSVPIQIRASPCSIHGTAMYNVRRSFFGLFVPSMAASSHLGAVYSALSFVQGSGRGLNM